MEQTLTSGAYGSFMPDTHRRLIVDEIQVHQTLGRALRTLEAVWNQGVSSTLSSIAEAAELSLPMKIVFFVLVDGWALVAGSLLKSFGSG